MIYADMTGPIIIGFLIGTLYWMFGPKSKGNKNMSLKDIVDNDPVLNKLDKEIEELNRNASERMIKEHPYTVEILEKYGFNPNNLTKEELIEKKRNKINSLKKEKIEKIEQYFNNGYINETDKNYYLSSWIENKEEHILEHNFISTKNLKDTDEEIWGYLLSELDKLLENDRILKVYGYEFGRKIIEGEVWLNMTESQLNESRGYPDDTEQELTPNGEIEVFIYGNKQSGSYFTLQDGKVIKIKDRQKKEY
jgi:hypothetical protein